MEVNNVIVNGGGAEWGLVAILLTLISIIVAIIVFYSTEKNKQRRHIQNQKEILKHTLLETHFLTKKKIKLEKNKEFGGHIQYFNDCVGKGSPHHDMRLLTENNNLDYSIEGKITSKVKELIFHANDKIRLLNYYRIAQTMDIEGKKRGMFFVVEEDYVRSVIKELEDILRELKNLIDYRFGISLNEN